MKTEQSSLNETSALELLKVILEQNRIILLTNKMLADYLVAPVWFEKEEVQNENRGTG